MLNNSDNLRDEMKRKVKDFLDTIHNYSDLEIIQAIFPSVINEELARRKKNRYRNLTFDYDIHRDRLKLVDLVAEDYFPCDFENDGFIFTYHPYYYCDKDFIDDTRYILCPAMLPTDKDVFLRWVYRSIPDKERRASEIYIDNMIRWYDDVEPFKPIVPYGENAKDYTNTLFRLTLKVMQTYVEPMVINGSGELENFKPEEIWVGVVDGKLHFATKETPRFIKMWKNLRNFTLS